MKMSKLSNQTNSQDPQAINSRVFVGNLNTFQCSKTDVERMFQRYGRLAGESTHVKFKFLVDMQTKFKLSQFQLMSLTIFQDLKPIFLASSSFYFWIWNVNKSFEWIIVNCEKAKWAAQRNDETTTTIEVTNSCSLVTFVDLRCSLVKNWRVLKMVIFSIFLI